MTNWLRLRERQYLRRPATGATELSEVIFNLSFNSLEAYQGLLSQKVLQGSQPSSGSPTLEVTNCFEVSKHKLSTVKSVCKNLKSMATNMCQDCPLLEVAQKRTGKGENGWETTKLSLESFSRQDANKSRLTVIFAQADKIRECLRCRQDFIEMFKVPKLWWSPWCRRSNGYFGCEDTTDEQGRFDGHSNSPLVRVYYSSADPLLDTWFRFLIKQTLEDAPKGHKDYLWYKFNIFTRWISSTNQSTVLVFDPRPAVKDRLPSPVFDSSDVFDVSDPYWIHALFAEEVLRLQDEAVWSVRNLVRETEIQRTTSTAPNPNYPRLHDIARHAIHVSETLGLAVETVNCMMTHHNQFFADRPAPDDRTKTTQRKIHKRMHLYHHMLGSLRSRSASNKERLLNEIQLAFNTVAQYDSRIGVEIGRAAQVDGSAMKTIAFLTLTFFPATFISAVFSMSFFSYNPDSDEWNVSKKFWVYLVVAIPITTITGLLWSFWRKFFPPKPIGGEELEQKPNGPNLAKREIKVMATKLRAKVEEGHIMEKV